MDTVLDWLARHRKMLAALAGFLLTWVVQQWGADDPWVSLAVGAATVLGVYQARNQPPAQNPQGRHSRPPSA